MPHLKIVNVSHGCNHKYENQKRKLYNCNADIYFNHTCLKKQLAPNYATIKIPNTSTASKYTQHKTTRIRLTNEIKYLYIKNN